MMGRHRAWAEEEILEMREMYLEGYSQYQIAQQFNTTQKTINKIVNMKAYKYEGLPSQYKRKLRNRKVRQPKPVKGKEE